MGGGVFGISRSISTSGSLWGSGRMMWVEAGDEARDGKDTSAELCRGEIL